MKINFPYKYRQDGIYLVKTIFILPALAAILALSTDVAFLLTNYTRAQSIADSAAMSAALESFKKGVTYDKVKAAAANALTLNEFSGTVEVGNNNNSIPTINQSINFAGNDHYVGVTVHGASPRFYSFMFKDNDFRLKAYAVAKIGGSGGGRCGGNGGVGGEGVCPGIYSLSTKKAVDLLQSSKFIVNDGGIYINVENFPKAIYGSGSGAELKADWIEITNADAGVGNIITSPTPVNVCPRETPEAPPENLPVKDKCVMDGGNFGCNCVSDNKGRKCDPAILEPAKYTGGLKIINTQGVTFANKANNDFSPTGRKLYYYHIIGGLSLENSSADADNVIIDTRYNDNIILSKNSTLTGVTRLYADSFILIEGSKIAITVFYKDVKYFDCGKIIKATIVN